MAVKCDKAPAPRRSTKSHFWHQDSLHARGPGPRWCFKAAPGPFCTSHRSLEAGPQLDPSWAKVTVTQASGALVAKGTQPRHLSPGPKVVAVHQRCRPLTGSCHLYFLKRTQDLPPPSCHPTPHISSQSHAHAQAHIQQGSESLRRDGSAPHQTRG